MWNRLALVLVLSALAPARALAGDGDGPPLSPTEKAQVAAELHSAIRLYFAHWEAIPDLDLDEAFAAYLEEAFAAQDRRGFDLATLAFVARLRNGHSGMEDARLGGAGSLPMGFRARPLGGEWVVTESLVPSLAVGDVLSAVDGEPVERVFERNRRYLCASSEREARLRLFGSRILFPEQFRLRVKGRDVTVNRRSLPPPKVAPSGVQGRTLAQGSVGYVRIPSFGEPAFEEEALRQVEALGGMPALIIDVRGNGGGATPGRLIERLMERPWRSWSSSTPLSVASAKVYGELLKHAEVPEPMASELRGFASFGSPHLYWPSEVTRPAPGAYLGALVLLVDAQCASACEDFVVPFKDNRRATLIGEPTWGSSGQPFMKRLPSGMTIRVGAKRERMPDGSPFEGIGIVPDVRVEPTAGDLRAGRDPVLAEAIRRAGASRPRGGGQRGDEP